MHLGCSYNNNNPNVQKLDGLIYLTDNLDSKSLLKMSPVTNTLFSVFIPVVVKSQSRKAQTTIPWTWCYWD